MLVFDGDEFLGGVPLVEDRRRGVRRYRLATAGSEHGLDLVAAPGRTDAVADAVGAWLHRSGNRIIDLSGVRADNALASCAPSTARVDTLETAPWFDVPLTFEDYLASRRKKFRQEIRRVIRRFDEMGARYQAVDTDETEQAIATLERLHDQRWDRRSLFRVYFAQFEAAALAGAARGEMRFHEVEVEGEVIASLATIEHRGTCYFFQVGRNPDPRWSNVGTVLYARVLERACSEGFAKIDLCYGESPSKLLWADHGEPVARVHWGHGPVGRAAHWALTALTPAADGLRRLRMRAGSAGGARKKPASAD